MRYNDRKAIRFGKSKFSKSIFNKELYNKWIVVNPIYIDVSFEEYKRIWKHITDEIQNIIITNPQGIKLPYQCGDLVVQYLPNVVKTTDAVNTSEMGEEVHHLNIVTKGKAAKISWIRKLAARFNPYIVMYGFEQTRVLGKKLYSKLNETPELFRNSKMKVYGNN